MRKFLSPFIHSVCAPLGILCFAISLLCTGCSDDDYEIYTSIYGVISDYETGEPIENANVVITPSGQVKQTGTDGVYSFENLDAQQQYTITVQRAGYQTNRKLVVAVSGERMEINISLTQIP